MSSHKKTYKYLRIIYKLLNITELPKTLKSKPNSTPVKMSNIEKA